MARTVTMGQLNSKTCSEEVGLVPNRSKFKIFAVDDDEETLGFIPDLLRTPDKTSGGD